MREATVSGLSGTAAALAGAAALWWWFSQAPAYDIRMRIGDPRNLRAARPTGISALPAIDLEGAFLVFNGSPSALTGAWPRFRGERFDNIARQELALADTWAPQGPPLVWSVELGEGHAGPAVRNGRVYLLDYDEKVGGDSLRCFSLDDGAEIWRRTYRVRTKRNHGISRTVPAVTDRYVVTMGPKCHVMCVDAETGVFRWGKDLVAEFGATVPLWYTGQCPLVDNGVAVLAPGGRALLVGVDCETGAVVWETPNPNGWKMSHSSVMPITLDGRKMYVYCAIGGVVGVAADGPNAGSVLWETTDWDLSVIAPSPVVFEDGRVFLTAGYGAGSMMIRVAAENGAFSVETLYRLDKSVFACEQQTPILYRGRLFGVLPNDAGALKREFACFDPAGKLVWTSGKTNRFGLGPFLVADEKILVLSDDGVLTMVRADTAAYEELARAKILEGRDAWGPMALVDGRLLVRDSKRLICLDVRANGGEGET